MRNNKGFTLIELLAVVAILITLIAIITPKIFKQLKTAEKVTDQEQINSIINVSKIYMNQNSNLLPSENDIYIISLNDLKQSGLIKTNQILNPSTKEELKGCILVKYENNKYKYEYKEENDCNNVITVTFDPQGGTIDQTTKQVIPNETYGGLPTPTREGYTFMGWNGKNLFTGLDKGIALVHYGNSAGTQYISSTSATSDFIELDFNSNDLYRVSGLTRNTNSYVAAYNENKDFIGRTGGSAHDSITFSNSSFTGQATGIGGELKYVRITQYDGSYDENEIDNLKIQLEVGDTATPYEPYYITPSTTVVQENNHTLKAIWQANS